MIALFGYPTQTAIVWALIAVLGALVVLWLATRNGETPPASAWVAIAVLLAAASIPGIGYLRSLTPYHVHVVVAGAGGGLNKVKVWSSAESDSTKVEGGWQIDIPSAQVPGSRMVMVWATLDPADLSHSKTVELRDDHWPTVVIPVGQGHSEVAGVVHDSNGRPVSRVAIALVGRAETLVLTASGGGFALPVPVDAGEQVEIEVSAFGKLNNLWVTGGNKQLVITVGKEMATVK